MKLFFDFSGIFFPPDFDRHESCVGLNDCLIVKVIKKFCLQDNKRLMQWQRRQISFRAKRCVIVVRFHDKLKLCRVTEKSERPLHVQGVAGHPS
jgi:hypothetical protein